MRETRKAIYLWVVIGSVVTSTVCGALVYRGRRSDCTLTITSATKSGGNLEIGDSMRLMPRVAVDFVVKDCRTGEYNWDSASRASKLTESFWGWFGAEWFFGSRSIPIEPNAQVVWNCESGDVVRLQIGEEIEIVTWTQTMQNDDGSNVEEEFAYVAVVRAYDGEW